MILARSQAEFDQCSRVGHRLALPALICLEVAHGFFACLVPRACGLSPREVVLADQSFLNCLRPLGVNFLLPAWPLLSRGAFSCRGRACLAPRFRSASRCLVLMGGGFRARSFTFSSVTAQARTRGRRSNKGGYCQRPHRNQLRSANLIPDAQAESFTLIN
jgi:hypothetical protein